jgi:RNA polymerase sigma-70 factor (ECF subfamily)
MGIANRVTDVDGLAIRMSAGEEEAFFEFSRTFGPRFRFFFIRRGLNTGDAEELAVSCVTDIALKIDKYQPLRVGGFEAWVFTLARRTLSDWRRARWPAEPLPDDMVAPAPQIAEDDEVNVDVITAVDDAFAQMPQADQVLITLRHFGREHSYAEISELLGISEEAARVRYFRARKRLKGTLLKDTRITKSYVRLKEDADK